MIKRHCDICGEVIPDDQAFVRMTKGQVNPNNDCVYAKIELDVCYNCYDAIDLFKKEELKHE